MKRRVHRKVKITFLVYVSKKQEKGSAPSSQDVLFRILYTSLALIIYYVSKCNHTKAVTPRMLHQKLLRCVFLQYTSYMETK